MAIAGETASAGRGGSRDEKEGVVAAIYPRVRRAREQEEGGVAGWGGLAALRWCGVCLPRGKTAGAGDGGDRGCRRPAGKYCSPLVLVLGRGRRQVRRRTLGSARAANAARGAGDPKQHSGLAPERGPGFEAGWPRWAGAG